MIKYRAAKKIRKIIKEGKVTPGSAQYLGRQVYTLSKSQPGGNYANPKRRRS